MIRLTLLAALTLLAFTLATLGLDWIDYGYGLNPWLAFPIAAFITIFVVRTIVMDIRHDIKLQRRARSRGRC